MHKWLHRMGRTWAQGFPHMHKHSLLASRRGRGWPLISVIVNTVQLSSITIDLLPFFCRTLRSSDSSLTFWILRLLPSLRRFSWEVHDDFGSSVSKLLFWLDTEKQIRFMFTSCSTDVLKVNSIIPVPFWDFKEIEHRCEQIHPDPALGSKPPATGPHGRISTVHSELI